MSKTIPICRRCSVKLDSENWYPSVRKKSGYICKTCHIAEVRNQQGKKPDETSNTALHRMQRNGIQPFDENDECSLFLGVHIAERVLSKVFKNVERMPMHNPGYDFICNHGKKIDVKSSCRRFSYRQSDRWRFYIGKNHAPDYFLCLAFDNRVNLNPEHVWLIPREDIGVSDNIGVSEATTDRWNKYALSIDKVINCYGRMKK